MRRHYNLHLRIYIRRLRLSLTMAVYPLLCLAPAQALHRIESRALFEFILIIQYVQDM
jgi:hypothetical protein